MNLLIVSISNCFIVGIVVLIHYEFLYRMTRMLPGLSIHHRYRILVGVVGALIAHVLEIWVFALAYFLMVVLFGWGSFSGHFDGSLLDCFYFSFTTYTTLGFGDIQPFGEVRYLTGIESLTGLLLITWTASFIYLEMQKYWDDA